MVTLTEPRKDDNLPEWLAQFKRELNQNKTEQHIAPSNGKNESKSPYSTATYKNAESVLLSISGQPRLNASDYNPFSFDDLAGYHDAIAKLKSLGLSPKANYDDQGIISALNQFHGLKSRPALKPILFVGDEEAEIEPLLQATIDALAMPTIKLNIQEGPGGLPAMALTANKTAVDTSKSASPFPWIADNYGLLIVEELENWDVFFDENYEFSNGYQPFMPIRLTPSGQELISLLKKCVDNVNVQILCTTFNREDVSSVVLDEFGTFNEISIDKPNKTERVEVWNKLSNKHPSLRGLNSAELADLTDNLTRRDIKMIAEDAISEAYQSGLTKGSCNSVTRENLFEKIILRQDKNSPAFVKLEDVLVNSFARSFDL